MLKSRSRIKAGFIRQLVGIGCLVVSSFVFAETLTINGFKIESPLIPADEILRGGPPRDGIPSIDSPRFVAAYEADHLTPDDRILGVSLNGIQRAYPIRILNYHEIVNDRFGEQAVVVSFCPLCGTGMVFGREFKGKPVEFGVSGLLYNSDLLMYDRHTESLWSQIEGKAVAGPLKGEELELLPAQHTTWEAWLEQHPKSQVLSMHTGFHRDYSRSPYPGYEASEYVYFPISNVDRRYHPKEPVLGIRLNGEVKVYPFQELRAAGARIEDQLGEQAILISYDDASQSARALDQEGQELPSIMAFWFAWMTFHPDSQVFTAKSL